MDPLVVWLILVAIIFPLLGVLSLFSIYRKVRADKAIRKAKQRLRDEPKRQVWYSTYRFASSWRHVALFVGRNKYEVRRDQESQRIQFSTKSYPATVDAASFNRSTHFPDQATANTTSQDVGAAGPFSLYLGPRQAQLQFNMIGHTTLTDAQITQFCKELDNQLVYNVLFHNCHHFAFIVACGLIKRWDRSAAWHVLFERDQRSTALAQIEPLTNQLPAFDGGGGYGGDSGGGVYGGGGFGGGDSGGGGYGGGDSGGGSYGGGDSGGGGGGGEEEDEEVVVEESKSCGSIPPSHGRRSEGPTWFMLKVSTFIHGGASATGQP